MVAPSRVDVRQVSVTRGGGRVLEDVSLNALMSRWIAGPSPGGCWTRARLRDSLARGRHHFELAGRTLPDWSAPEYPGYPLVIEGRRRTALVAASYAALSLAFVIVGLVFTTGRRKTT